MLRCKDFGAPQRIAIISTHPIQYYAPWFRFISAHSDAQLRVFFLLQPGPEGVYDRGFQRDISWDMPLLEGYPHEFVPNSSANPEPGDFWSFRNPGLKNCVAGFRPDVVLLVGYNFWSMLRFILTWDAKRVPLMLKGDSHRIVARPSALARLRQSVVRRLFRRFSAFLYVGQANKRYFELHGVPQEELFHSPHAIDNERFAAQPALTRADAALWRRDLGIAEGTFVFLFAGKFEDKKRPLDLLEAFRSLDDTRDAALLFVGNGSLEGELREASRSMPNVFLAPFQNQSAMPRTYAACDILVLPSYGPFETWGLAVNEAMCLGKPAIVSSHVGCAEDLVVPEATGLVFTAGDRQSLADALRKALSSRDEVEAWGSNARSRIAAYDYSQATRGLLKAAAYAAGEHGG